MGPSSRVPRVAVPATLLMMMVLAVSVAPAGAATQRMTPRHRASVRASLLRAVRRHPGVVSSHAFLRRASLVNFKLPITIRLRQGANPAVTNVNRASVDLGASLGQREVDLGGHLPGELTFHDSYDGGALGEVDITLLPGGDLTTNAIPLLWDDQVASAPGTHWYDGGDAPTAGCSDFTNAGAVPSLGTATSTVGRTLETPLAAAGVHGLPYFATQADASVFAATGNPALAAGAIEAFPGADDVALLHADHVVGDPNGIGGNDEPFPFTAASRPGGFAVQPSARDTVLRTAPLHLAVAVPGTEFAEQGPSPAQDGNGPQGSMDIVLGKSGGQANLFGNIPGKDTQIEITANFATKITSILREVDADPAGQVAGQPYSAGAYNCRQFWTGTVQNYLNDITLVGGLHIAPGITPDGHLRIAKASLASDDPWDVSLAACLLPHSTFSASAGVPLVPADAVTGQTATGASPINPEPTGVPCNSAPSPQIAASSVPPLAPLLNDPHAGTDGSQVSVAGTITVPQIEADVLIGDTH
ncbi:MAG: hypothetical protein JWR63_1966 [Conexibacter sp.]|nr:hypothetical protein [Conexibacter sp.]